MLLNSVINRLKSQANITLGGKGCRQMRLVRIDMEKEKGESSNEKIGKKSKG